MFVCCLVLYHLLSYLPSLKLYITYTYYSYTYHSRVEFLTFCIAHVSDHTRRMSPTYHTFSELYCVHPMTVQCETYCITRYITTHLAHLCIILHITHSYYIVTCFIILTGIHYITHSYF